MNVGIIGAGLAGLSIAYRLSQAGIPVTVYERGQHVGGNVRSRLVQGYLVEEGPATIALGEGPLKALIQEVGLGASLIPQLPTARKRYLLRKGKLRKVTPPALLFGNALLPLAARFCLLREPWVRTPPAPQETLAQFITRRLGPGLLPLADAFVAGIYAGDVHRLSAADAFPKLVTLEQQYGSLFKGMRRLPKRQPYSFADGMQQLPLALAAALSTPVRTHSHVARLAQGATGWELWAPDDTLLATHSHVVVTTPLHSSPDLPPGHSWPVLEYPPVTLVALGFGRSAIRHPLDGFGFLVPGDEESPVLGVQFISSVFPGRAPAGKVLLSCFIGGSRQPELAVLPQEALTHTVVQALTPLLGIAAPPELVHVVRYPQAIPQYTLAYAQARQQMDALERALPGLQLAGNYRHGVSVPDTVAGALALADTLCKSPAALP